MDQKLSFFSIGRIDNKNLIQLNKDYIKGLKFLEKFSHIHVFIWINKKYQKKTGCFASRDILRPFPVASEIVKIKTVNHKSGIIEVEDFKNPGVLPVIDIKPYMPVEDFIEDVKSPLIKLEKLSEINKIEELKDDLYYAKPIGVLVKEKSSVIIKVSNIFADELKGLNEYSHIQVLWFFDKFDKPRYRKFLQVNPPYNGPVTGVFATRSPVRPNPLALTNVRLLDVDLKNSLLKVDNIDAFSNTPVLDIKPYIADIDGIRDTKEPPWQAHWPRVKTEVRDNKPEEISLKQADIEMLMPVIDIEYKDKNEFGKGKAAERDSNNIIISGARQNNLKNIDVKIPLNKFTVITGLSGSGKTSLAFDTLYSEGKRQYMQSLSSSSRLSEAVLEKPDFDHIDNLLPAIAIEQKSIGRNPRSTVGTISDIYNYLRLLYTKLGTRHCISCGRSVKAVSGSSLARIILDLPEDTELELYYGRERDDKKLLSNISLKNPPGSRELLDILKQGYKDGKGFITLLLSDSEIIKVSEKEACPYCDILLFPLHTSVFSFNSPEGMCPDCKGLGKKRDIDVNAIVDPEKSLLDGAAAVLGYLRKHREKPTANWMRSGILALAQAMKVDLEIPWKSLPEEFRQKVLYGTGDKEYSFTYKSGKTGREGTITRSVEGVVSILKRLFLNSARSSEEKYQHILSEIPCDVCSGERLAPEGRMVTLGGKRFPQAAFSTIKELYDWFENLSLMQDTHLDIADQIFQESGKLLKSIMDLGLHYLNLDRSVTTLSGGEAQRIRLATQMSCRLKGVLYVLDEPSIWLHSRDLHRIINSMKNIRDEGNTVVVVEHDLDTIREADYIIDLGPAAGISGGNIIASGSPEEILKNKNSVTGPFLSGKTQIKRNKELRNGSGKRISIHGAKLHNLKNVSLSIPLGCITCITGVSGSGKSTLIRNTLVPAIKQKLSGMTETVGPYDVIEGLENIDKIIIVDQSPIGKSPRSNPATYTGLFDEIRNLFAATEMAKKRKYKAGRFSFNDKSGQCEECSGQGRKKIEMLFLADIWVTCSECKGKRYNPETLDVLYKSKSIFDILEMDISEAYSFFCDNKAISSSLQILMDVGLSYLKLGQSALTLSGGESQRIKLASELKKPDTGKTVYVLDEPTSGLHPGDIQKLLDVLNRLADIGNTLIIIEHNLDVIQNADWIVDLGPEGGADGGRIVAVGNPAEIIKIKESYTGEALKKSCVFNYSAPSQQ